MRTSRHVGNRRGQCIDAKRMIERRKNLLKADGSLRCFSTQAIGSSDDLTSLEPSSSHQSARDVGPMVTTGILVDLGRPSELSPGHDRGRFEKPSVIEVAQQRAEGLIEVGKILFGDLEVVAVPIPKE